MAILDARGHSNSAIYEGQARRGWDKCMSKNYCKWPVIAGIVIGIIVACLTLYCCLKCCGCCRGKRKRDKKDDRSIFAPAPYQGYQPANANVAPPAYGPPPTQYAQYDHSSGGGYRAAGKTGEDSLPAMPSWSDARQTKVEEHGVTKKHEDVEMGNLHKPALASTANLPPQGYTGPDFNAGAGAVAGYGHQQQQQHQYTGPDFSHPTQYQQPTGYSAYSASESTRYEPSRANEPQELGTTYSNTLPPLSPSAQQTGFGGSNAPGVLQAGRRS